MKSTVKIVEKQQLNPTLPILRVSPISSSGSENLLKIIEQNKSPTSAVSEEIATPETNMLTETSPAIEEILATSDKYPTVEMSPDGDQPSLGCEKSPTIENTSNSTNDQASQMSEKIFSINDTVSMLSTGDFIDNLSEPSSCAQCKTIQNELKKKPLNDIGTQYTPEFNDGVEVEDLTNAIETNSSVWQVPNTVQNEDKVKAPLETFDSVFDGSSKVEIDSTSFIILRDEPVKDPIEQPNDVRVETRVERVKVKDMSTETMEQNSSRSRCSDCCFCNPNLHRSADGTQDPPKTCNYCKQQRANDGPKIQETETKSTNTVNVYESLSTVDHTHVRTKDKDSDTVSLKCTKTNSKIRRFVPDDVLKAGLIGKKHRERPPPASMVQRKKDIHLPAKNLQNNSSNPIIDSSRFDNPLPTSTPNTKRSKFDATDAEVNDAFSSRIHFPSPFAVLSSPASYAESSSRCSQSSSSSSSSPKKCPTIFPATGNRWQSQPPPAPLQQQQQQQQQFHSSHPPQQKHGSHSSQQVQQSKIRHSRYHEFYGNTQNNNLPAARKKSVDSNENTGKTVP